MNDFDRAEWLDRSIEDILRGGDAREPPEGLDEQDVDGLLRVASARLRSAQQSAHSGITHEGTVWRHVLQRLDRRRRPRPDDPLVAVLTDDRPAGASDSHSPTDEELEQLRDIVGMRRRMAQKLVSFSETYRDDVWERLNTRFEQREPKKERKGLFSFFRRSNDEADVVSPQLDQIALHADDDTLFELEPDADGVLAAAHVRKQFSRAATRTGEEQRVRIWNRIRADVERESVERTSDARGWIQPRWVMTAAAAALVVAALGPIPATGLAHHPAVEAAQFAGKQLGVTETASVVSVPDGGVTIEPQDSTAAEAAVLLGLAVHAPDTVPGFELTASQVFAQPITATEGGTFVLTYQGSSPAQSLAVYQEVAGGFDLSAGNGSSEPVTLADGTPATYVDGSWDMFADGGAEWEFGGTQTLIFEREGVRTIIRYTGPAIDQSALTSIANSLH